MAFSPYLLQSMAPKPAQQFADEAVDAEQKRTAGALQLQNAQQDAATKRRLLGVSLLNGLQNEQDPSKQAALYSRLRPMALQIDPTLELPEQYDGAFVNALSAGTVTPEKQAELDISREKANDADVYKQFLMDQKTQAAEDRKEKNLNTETERLSKQFESGGLSDLTSAVENANTLLAPYLNQEGTDVPGFGEVAGMLPDLAVSQEGKDLRQAYSSVRNSILKARSGGAVTDGEAARLLQELGEGTGMPDNQVVKGMSNVTTFLRDRIANIQAGYSPEAVQTYEQRGGTVKQDRLKAPGKQPIVTTQEQYDALPSGSLYREDDGNLYVKP